MQILLIIAVFILLAALAAAFAWFSRKIKVLTEKKNDDGMLKNVMELMKITKEELQTTQKINREELQFMRNEMQKRLEEHNRLMQESNQTVGIRLDNASKVVGTVTNKLSQLEEANKRIYDVGKDIASLQEILRAPKLRGGFSELFLGDLLSQILPNENFALQYHFKSGENVDAIVKLRDNLMVPIDAKFPLENFQKALMSERPEDKDGYLKIFASDVKKHIDKIAKLYILPDEGTFDFALMYIPAENIYYETIIKNQERDDIVSYAHKKKVMPVSPNTLYIYLQAISIGLKGLQIEKGAKDILLNLQRLKGNFVKFDDDFRLLGKHLVNARNTYDNSEKRLEKFNDKLEMIALKEENGKKRLKK